ncbi:MAG TPA: DinB family protein [Chitinophagaceae bacterium]|nr:DinB family protein [Chitinophagaceae bacterium]
MSIIQMLLKEMDREAQTTRKMLACVPNDKYDSQPHEKSMTIRRLATHIAELPSWVSMALD